MARKRSETSLRAKLLTLGVDDDIFLIDTYSKGKATIMERAVTTMIGRDPELAQRRFTTERWVATSGTETLKVKHLIRIRRLSVPEDTRTVLGADAPLFGAHLAEPGAHVSE